MFTSTKKGFLLCFCRATEKGKKERGGVWSELSDKRTKRGGLHSAPQQHPHPPQKKIHRASGWPHRAPGQRWEERSLLCLPSVWCLKKHTHICTATYTQAYAHVHAYAQTRICLKVALTSRSALGQPEHCDQTSASTRFMKNVEIPESQAGPSALLSCTKTS